MTIESCINRRDICGVLAARETTLRILQHYPKKNFSELYEAAFLHVTAEEFRIVLEWMIIKSEICIVGKNGMYEYSMTPIKNFERKVAEE